MKDKLSRRDFFGKSVASLAVLGAVATMPARVHAAPLLKRKNIDDLTTTELNNYIQAIKVMKDRSAAAPNVKDGYDYQAQLHNLGRNHPDGTSGACEHGSEEFLPWHRAHLAGFEKLLQATHADAAEVTIPYWDWTKAASGNRFPESFEVSTSPLHHTGRWSVASGAPDPIWSADDIKTIVTEPDWNLFAGDAKSMGSSTGSLEGGPHNPMHGLIGPIMGDPNTAAEDPIYWSFHSFLDLIWSRWQKRHTQIYQCGSCTLWLEPYRYAVDTMTRTEDFGYEYDYDYTIDGPLPTPLVIAGGRPLNARASGARALSAEAPSSGAPATKARTLLRLEGVKTFRNITYELKIYLHPKDMDVASLSAEEASGYLVSTRTIWRAHASSHDHHSQLLNLYVDIGDAIAGVGTPDWTVTVKAESLPLVDRSTSAYQDQKATEDVSLDPLSNVIQNIELEVR